MHTYAWLSDTHFNMVKEECFVSLVKSIRMSQAQGIWLTGDIAESHDVEKWLLRLSKESEKPVYYVLGNHDYYHSSFARVDQQMKDLNQREEQIFWLDKSEAIWLNRGTALVGVGGWGDARVGDFVGTPIRINDHRLIQEITGHERSVLRAKLQQLGAEMATVLQQKLLLLKEASSIWVLTHVPPFEGACWYQGNAGNPQWTPHFVCAAVGDVLDDFARDHPHIDIQVLCGHGHNRGFFQKRKNLRTYTAAAEYGNPVVEMFFSIV